MLYTYKRYPLLQTYKRFAGGAMSKAQLNKELSTMLMALFNSVLIAYRLYAPYINCILLLLVAYLGFKLGRRSVLDPIEADVKRVDKLLKQRHLYSIALPQKLVKLAVVRRIVLVVTALSGSLVLLKFLKLKIKMLKLLGTRLTIQTFLVCCFLLIVAWGCEIWLDWSIKKGRNASLYLNEELFQLVKLIGPRGQSILRLHLCRQKLIHKKKQPAGICYKQNCIQLRQYLKERSELIQGLVMHAITYRWCAICSQLKPFEEYLPFEHHLYYSDPALQEEQEVGSKNNYLMGEIQRMCSWVRSVGPCNCSKIYWRAQVQYIRAFKAGEKALQERFRSVRVKNGL